MDAIGSVACCDERIRASDRGGWLVAFRLAELVTSDTIVYVKAGAIRGPSLRMGNGAGQMNRVDSARIAVLKAKAAAEAAGGAESEAESRTQGSVVASDALFPFADGLLAAIAAGATAAIQPGGSARDNEVIAAAGKAGLAMVFTGMRHFRH